MDEFEERIQNELAACVDRWGTLAFVEGYGLSGSVAFLTRVLLEHVAGTVGSGIEAAKAHKTNPKTSWRVATEGWTEVERAAMMERAQPILKRLWATVENDLREIQRIEREG